MLGFGGALIFCYLRGEKSERAQAMDLKDTQVVAPKSFWGEAAKWGLYMGVLLGAVCVVQIGWMKLDVPWWINALMYTVYIVLLYAGIASWRKQRAGGYISYGQCMQFGVMQSVFSGVVYLLVWLIMALYIRPEYTGKMREYVLKALRQSVDEEQLELALRSAAFYTSAFFLAVSAFVGAVLNGIFVSLVVSIFLKRNRPISE